MTIFFTTNDALDLMVGDRPMTDDKTPTTKETVLEALRILNSIEAEAGVRCTYCGDTHAFSRCRSGGPHDFERSGHSTYNLDAEDFATVRDALAAETAAREVAEARAERAEGLLREARELVAAVTLETVDYMTRNKLGDPQEQHNVKWACRFLASLDATTPPTLDTVGSHDEPLFEMDETDDALSALDAADDAVMQGAAVEAMAEALEWALDTLAISTDGDWRDDMDRMAAIRAAYRGRREGLNAALAAYRSQTKEGE